MKKVVVRKNVNKSLKRGVVKIVKRAKIDPYILKTNNSRLLKDPFLSKAIKMDNAELLRILNTHILASDKNNMSEIASIILKARGISSSMISDAKLYHVGKISAKDFLTKYNDPSENKFSIINTTEKLNEFKRIVMDLPKTTVLKKGTNLTSREISIRQEPFSGTILLNYIRLLNDLKYKLATYKITPHEFNRMKMRYLLDLAEVRPEYLATIAYIVYGDGEIGDWEDVKSAYSTMGRGTKWQFIKELDDYIKAKLKNPHFSNQLTWYRGSWIVPNVKINPPKKWSLHEDIDLIKDNSKKIRELLSKLVDPKTQSDEKLNIVKLLHYLKVSDKDIDDYIKLKNKSTIYEKDIDFLKLLSSALSFGMQHEKSQKFKTFKEYSNYLIQNKQIHEIDEENKRNIQIGKQTGTIMPLLPGGSISSKWIKKYTDISGFDNSDVKPRFDISIQSKNNNKLDYYKSGKDLELEKEVIGDKGTYYDPYDSDDYNPDDAIEDRKRRKVKIIPKRKVIKKPIVRSVKKCRCIL